MKIKLLTIAATIFTVVAALVGSSACLWGFYQPEEPSSLNK
jgi:cyclic lactone autoinducer peptide